MKSQVAPYGTRALCLRIVCTDGQIFRITRYPHDLKMSNGDVYLTGTGFDFTGYQSTSTMSPSAIDLEGFVGFAGITRAMIGSGVFDNARCYLFACDFRNPILDYEPIVASILGKVTLEDDRYRIEEMALVDALNQSVGKTYTPQCQKTFGGTDYAGCGINLATYTYTGTLTGVTDSSIVTDSARAEASDYFGLGTIKFTSGLNAGLAAKEIKSFASGVIEVYEAFYYLPVIGDAYTITGGCRKRLSDCRDKWNNVVNFGGFSFIPTSSQYAQVGTK